MARPTAQAGTPLICALRLRVEGMYELIGEQVALPTHAHPDSAASGARRSPNSWTVGQRAMGDVGLRIKGGAAKISVHPESNQGHSDHCKLYSQMLCQLSYGRRCLQHAGKLKLQPKYATTRRPQRIPPSRAPAHVGTRWQVTAFVDTRWQPSWAHAGG